MKHGSFWDTVSRQLWNKGPDYISRCKLRNKPLNTGDNVIGPASFSRLPVQEVQEAIPLVKGCEEDLANVCTVILWDLIHTDTLNVQIHSMLVYVPAKYFTAHSLISPATSLEKSVILSQVRQFSIKWHPC